MGFDYFYGYLGGETDQWQPYLFRNTTQVFPWVGKPGYNLTTDMADEAIKYMRDLNAAAPHNPFFVYYVPGGSHAPHQPTQEWIDKYKGTFGMGYEKLREQISENQKRLGVIPANAKLTPWPDDLPKWDSLTATQKKLQARQAEVFAAYTAYTDYEIGRVIQNVEDMGKLENTLIIYIDGDNGTSAEGSLTGTYNVMTAYNGVFDVPEALQIAHYEAWGSDKRWAWAFDTCTPSPMLACDPLGVASQMVSTRLQPVAWLRSVLGDWFAICCRVPRAREGPSSYCRRLEMP